MGLCMIRKQSFVLFGETFTLGTRNSVITWFDFTRRARSIFLGFSSPFVNSDIFPTVKTTRNFGGT